MKVKHDSIPVQRRKLKTGIKRSVSLLVALVILSGGYIGFKLYQNAAKLAGTSNPLSLVSSFTATSLKETNGRVNILLAGYSADDAGHQGADLTDSIMILSIDIDNDSAVVISVPRDLYVNVPGYGYSKINAAYEEGEAGSFSASGYADGGMGLLEETISQDFGVTFSYEALINYTTFKDAVDAVGGVNVTIASTNANGLYDPNTNLKLANGAVTLTGQEALDLARARGDGVGSYGFTNGDFDRTAHQQQILVALKNKMSTASVISNPLKIGSLADAIGNNVKTDMTIGEMETLFTKVKGISDAHIVTVTLNSYDGTDYLKYYTTSTGQSALVPAAGTDDYTAIQALVSGLIGTSSSTTTSDTN